MKYKFISITIIVAVFFYLSIMLYAGAVIVDFRGEPGSNKVTLYWSTLSETNCKGFQIERSLNKTDFEKSAPSNSQGCSMGYLNFCHSLLSANGCIPHGNTST